MKNSAIQPCPIVKNRKISAPGKETKPATSNKTEDLHKKCFQTSLGPEKSRPPSVHTKVPLRLSTDFKKLPEGKKALENRITLSKLPTLPSRPPSVQVKPSLKLANSNKPTDKKEVNKSLTQPKSPASRPPTVSSRTSSALSASSRRTVPKNSSTSTLTPPSRLEVSLSREDLKQLAIKFEVVSTSLVQIATSKRPVGVRSLEALLNLEISNCLGEGVNDPSYSQGFVQSTRRLLEELVLLNERGKLNPELLCEKGKQPIKPFIRATSATTVCYRDRYFKELVMNVLQSMTTGDIEEEVSCKAERSGQSRERIRVIRDMVRTEAGLEPEDFRALERRLEELRRTLSRNKLEMEKAASEVDDIIAQHVVRPQLSASGLQIPRPAREALKASCKRLESGSDRGKTGACKSKLGCSEQTPVSKNVAEDASGKYKKSLDIVGDKDCFEKGNSDEVQNIRPQLKQLVHEELLRIKTKEEEILNQDRDIDRNDRLVDSPRSSFESVDFKSAASNFSGDEDNEMVEYTHTSLEALKARIEENQTTNEDILSCALQGVCIRVLERIEEKEEINYTESNEETTRSSINISGREDSSTSLTSSSTELESRERYGENVVCENQCKKAKCVIERIKSKWFLKEEKDVENVLAEMKGTFDVHGVLSDVFSTFKNTENYKKENGDLEEAKTSYIDDSEFYLLDFTVGEVANVLVNISVKINNLPEFIKETETNNLPDQRKEASDILSVLHKCMSASNPTDLNSEVALDETTLPIKEIAKTFSFLSDTLNYSPSEMKSKSMFVMNPPKSLIDTLRTLSRTPYFKDCFAYFNYNGNEQKEMGKQIKVVKPYSMNESASSGEMLHFATINDESLGNNLISTRNKIYSFTRDIKRPGDLNTNLGKFEQFIGRSASVMTIQNVSDMFLFLSAVLNDVPERLKLEKIIDLDPPSSLQRALDILYCENDFDSVTDLEKKKSFASLTIQNVSDFLLTLSKTFDDVPERLKNSVVTDLNPPPSLLRAITLLTSISQMTIIGSIKEEKEEEEVLREKINPSDNRERFYDAVASLSSIS